MKTSELYKQKRSEGFTIIEVMIVLAIAGLIMVIVFIAIPQLQKNQRDTARKSVVNRIKAELDNSASNNNGRVPTDATALGTFNTTYLANIDTQDPRDDNKLQPAWQANRAAVPNVGEVFYRNQTECNGENRVTNTSARQYAMWARLESGATYCLDNR